MGHSLPDCFIQMDLIPCCKSRAGDGGEIHKNTCGSVRAHWPGYVDRKRHTHFRNFLKKELEEETPEEGEEPTPPASAEIEAGIVVTHARQCQQYALKEEECLRQEQDGPVITRLDSVDSGEKAEGTEDLEPEEGQADVLGEPGGGAMS